MLDLIFVVDDAAEWHRENIARNSHHYSFLQYYGVDTIANVQRAAAGVYYNTLIEINGQVCLRFIMLIGCCTITVTYIPALGGGAPPPQRSGCPSGSGCH